MKIMSYIVTLGVAVYSGNFVLSRLHYNLLIWRGAKLQAFVFHPYLSLKYEFKVVNQ